MGGIPATQSDFSRLPVRACPRCPNTSARPCHATSINQDEIEIELRCSVCHHVWTVIRRAGDPPIFALKPDRRTAR